MLGHGCPRVRPANTYAPWYTTDQSLIQTFSGLGGVTGQLAAMGMQYDEDGTSRGFNWTTLSDNLSKPEFIAAEAAKIFMDHYVPRANPDGSTQTNSMTGQLMNLFGGIVGAFKDGFNGAFDAIASGIEGAIDFFGDMFGRISGAAESLWNWITGGDPAIRDPEAVGGPSPAQGMRNANEIDPAIGFDRASDFDQHRHKRVGMVGEEARYFFGGDNQQLRVDDVVALTKATTLVFDRRDGTVFAKSHGDWFMNAEGGGERGWRVLPNGLLEHFEQRGDTYVYSVRDAHGNPVAGVVRISAAEFAGQSLESVVAKKAPQMAALRDLGRLEVEDHFLSQQRWQAGPNGYSYRVSETGALIEWKYPNGQVGRDQRGNGFTSFIAHQRANRDDSTRYGRFMIEAPQDSLNSDEFVTIGGRQFSRPFRGQQVHISAGSNSRLGSENFPYLTADGSGYLQSHPGHARGHNDFDAIPRDGDPSLFAATGGTFYLITTSIRNRRAMLDVSNGFFIQIGRGQGGIAMYHQSGVAADLISGAEVDAGQYIGRAGNNGNSGGMHVHFDFGMESLNLGTGQQVYDNYLSEVYDNTVFTGQTASSFRGMSERQFQQEQRADELLGNDFVWNADYQQKNREYFNGPFKQLSEEEKRRRHIRLR